MNAYPKPESLLRGLALTTVVVAGLMTILATTGSGGDTPAQSFAKAGPDRNIVAGVVAPLDGTLSETPIGADPGNETVRYLWQIVSAPLPPPELEGLQAYDLDDPDRVIARLRPRFAGEYIAQLRIDYGRLAAIDSVTLTAFEGPKPPNANAGPDQFAKHGARVTLDGSNSDELEGLALDGQRLRYQWFVAENPVGASATLSSRNEVKPGMVVQFAAHDVSGLDPRFSSYRVRLHTVDSTDLVSDPNHVTVRVFPAEGYVYPMPVAGPRQHVRTGATVNLDGSASYDVDGHPLTYAWQFYSRPPGSRAALVEADTATASFVADVDGVYVVKLAVDNGQLASPSYADPDGGPLGRTVDYGGIDRVVVVADSVNTEPVVDAGPDRQMVYTGAASIPLDGSASYDADGHLINYHWLLVSAPPGSGAGIGNPLDTAPDSASLLIDLEGSYVVGLNPFPFDHIIDHAVITLSGNTAPVADAGPDQQVVAGDTVLLDGSASSDADGDTLGYAWSMVSAPDPWGEIDDTWRDWPALSDARSATPSFVTSRNGSYRLHLTVNDGHISSPADEVLIEVSGATGNTPPIAVAGADQPDAVTGLAVLLDGSASSDADGDTLGYSWTFDSVPPGSSAAFDDPAAVAPSFTPDLDGEYAIRLTVNDGTATSLPDTVLVTATSGGGACVQPMTLVTALPFQPGLGEVASYIRIDGTSLSAGTRDLPLDIDVVEARFAGDGQAEFIVLGPAWEAFDRSHANPVSDSESMWLIVRRTVDDIYYRVDLDFTVDVDLFEIRIDALAACRCGTTAVACPP